MSGQTTGHGLSLPSPGQVCVSVLRVSGDHGVAVWRAICGQAGVPVVAPTYTFFQLTQIADVLASRTGALATVGRSLRVRLTSYETLTRSPR